MAQIDTEKETIAYLKFWLGVMVVSDITLVGWVLSKSGIASDLKIYGATAGIVIITTSAFFIHKKISSLILELKDL